MLTMRNALRLLVPLLVTAALAGSTLKARASTLVVMTLPDLVQRADAIFVGRVVTSSSFERGPRIFTVHRILVERPVSKGLLKAGETVDLLTEGGRGERWSQVVLGEAVLKPGEESLFFVARSGDRFFSVGMAQGVYPVIRDPGKGTELIQPARISARLVGTTPGGMADAAPWLREPRPLEEVIEAIRALLERKP